MSFPKIAKSLNTTPRVTENAYRYYCKINPRFCHTVCPKYRQKKRANLSHCHSERPKGVEESSSSIVIPEFRKAKYLGSNKTKKERNPNMYPFSIYNLFRPKPKHTWAQVRILKETDKAILVECGTKIWIPKSKIHAIRLKKNVFEVWVEESVVG